VEAGSVRDVAASYGALATRLGSIAPLIAVPGNCDDPAALAAAFPVPALAGVASLGANSVRVVNDAVAVIGLDSSIPGRYEGRLPTETLAWLETALAALPAGTPVLLAFHQPPMPIGHASIDPLGLQEPDALAALVAGEPRIVGILVGHTHGATSGSFAGRPVIVGPGIHSGMTLAQEAPSTPPSLLDFAVPPGIALHWVEGSTLTTHFRAIAG
ncbi:MAG: hypothetical protein WBA46_08470, partial [Thermomicrobiales bacterium]